MSKVSLMDKNFAACICKSTYFFHFALILVYGKVDLICIKDQIF